MNEIKNRLKSPVVIIQLIGIITGVAIWFVPQATENIQVVTTAITSIINVVAGLNNPTDRSKW